MTTSTFTLADRAMTHLGQVVDSLTADDLDRQSPCPDWKVRDVLAHIVGTANALADYARTGERVLPEELRPLSDPIRSAQQSLRATHSALASDSDAAGAAAGDVAIEFTTHAWDLDPAVAIPDSLAVDVLEFVQPLVTDELRQQFFAAEVTVADDASAGDRLLAFLGRDPVCGVQRQANTK